MDAPLRGDLRPDAFLQGQGRGALDGYVRVANDILFNPEETIKRVEQAYEGEVEAGEDGSSQASLNGECGLVQIERVSEDLQLKAEQFEDCEEALRERFQQAMD